MTEINIPLSLLTGCSLTAGSFFLRAALTRVAYAIGENQEDPRPNAPVESSGVLAAGCYSCSETIAPLIIGIVGLATAVAALKEQQFNLFYTAMPVAVTHLGEYFLKERYRNQTNP